MTFPKEFKEAIQNLPSAEKDKLIFRLLKHDLDLANRLHFELVNTETVEERRSAIQKEVTKAVTRMSDRFYSLGYLLMDIRDLSGTISEHVRITKDKFGEASLNIQMLNKVLKTNKIRLENSKTNDTYKINIYVIARAFKILLLVNSLHEDYLMEFKESLNELGTRISQNSSLMKTAINNGLDVNWLLEGEIPENIIAIHKEIRSNGFLK
ncbi:MULTISPECIES: hypothetical protein [unclassified Flavobacterium]|jgi:hypothetical protein|uniref:hypothetical protein n=1 Tax=unclassified Flavobacterium TaxID=196869 RepID=UPI0025C57AB7|nr:MULTISPECIES: hypothetical protein [unclassified Flavobacterium]